MINFTVSNHTANNFIAYSETIEEFCNVIKSDINYSPFIFKDNYRNENNSLLNYCNCLIFDFDDNIDLIDGIDLFKQYTCIVATTRNHQKEKNGKVRDRFRIVLPLDKPLNTTKEDFKNTMSLLIYRYGADNACKDIARFYYGYRDSEVIVNYGSFFDYETALKQSILWNKLKNQQKQIQKETKLNFQVPQKQYQNSCETKMEWFYKYAHTQQMLNYFEFDKRFGAGGRNTYLFGVAKHFQEHGCDSDFIKYEVLWINSNGSESLEESEIERTIFKSLRL